MSVGGVQCLSFVAWSLDSTSMVFMLGDFRSLARALVCVAQYSLIISLYFVGVPAKSLCVVVPLIAISWTHDSASSRAATLSPEGGCSFGTASHFTCQYLHAGGPRHVSRRFILWVLHRANLAP